MSRDRPARTPGSPARTPGPPARRAGSPARTPVVELYGRPGCCLCDEARVTLERLRDELGFRLVELDITADEAVHRAYFERIPVIALDGDELFDFRVDDDVLRIALAGSGMI